MAETKNIHRLTSRSESFGWLDRYLERRKLEDWEQKCVRESMEMDCGSDAVGEGDGTPLQHSRLEDPMDGGAWWAAVHGVAKSWTPLSDFTFTFPFHALEKAMATHSSVLAWRIPGTGEPGGLPSMGSHKVGHDWSDLAAAAAVTQRGVTDIQLLV